MKDPNPYIDFLRRGVKLSEKISQRIDPEHSPEDYRLASELVDGFSDALETFGATEQAAPDFDAFAGDEAPPPPAGGGRFDTFDEAPPKAAPPRWKCTACNALFGEHDQVCPRCGNAACIEATR